MPYPNITEITVFHPTLLLVLFLDESALLRFRWNLNFRLHYLPGHYQRRLWGCGLVRFQSSPEILNRTWSLQPDGLRAARICSSWTAFCVWCLIANWGWLLCGLLNCWSRHVLNLEGHLGLLKRTSQTRSCRDVPCAPRIMISWRRGLITSIMELHGQIYRKLIIIKLLGDDEALDSAPNPYVLRSRWCACVPTPTRWKRDSHRVITYLTGL